MGNVDVKWPSEDEEFDTKSSQQTGTKPVEGAEAPADQQPSLSAEPAEQTAPEVPDEPDEPIEVPTEEPPVDDPKPTEEVASDEQTAEDKTVSEPSAPVAATAVTAAAVTAPAAAKVAHKGGAGRLLLDVVLVLAVLGLAAWGFNLNQKNTDLKKQNTDLQGQVTTLNDNPAIVEQKKTAELVSKVKALMNLPANETPQAGQVADAASFIKQNPAFSSVQNGDQVLIYSQSGTVIVYRPSTNKIVQTGKITLTQTAPAASAATKH